MDFLKPKHIYLNCHQEKLSITKTVALQNKLSELCCCCYVM